MSEWDGIERRGSSNGRRTEQDRPPLAPDEVCVQDEVISYIETSKRTGVAKYGTVLRPNNGRDALRDAFEEAVDLVQYLAQALIERDGALPDTLSPVGLASLRSRCGTDSIGYSIEWWPANDDMQLPEHAAVTLYDRSVSTQRLLWEANGETVEELANGAVEWLRSAKTQVPVDA